MTESNEVTLTPHAEGTIFFVRALPGSRNNQLKGVHDAQLKVAVTAAPEKGKANKAIMALLAAELGLKKTELAILSGETSSRKQVLAQGLTVEQLRHRIARALGQAANSCRD